MYILAVIAFVLATIAQFQAKGQSLVAWSVMALALIPALAFFRAL